MVWLDEPTVSSPRPREPSVSWAVCFRGHSVSWSHGLSVSMNRWSRRPPASRASGLVNYRSRGHWFRGPLVSWAIGLVDNWSPSTEMLTLGLQAKRPKADENMSSSVGLVVLLRHFLTMSTALWAAWFDLLAFWKVIWGFARLTLRSSRGTSANCSETGIIKFVC